MNRIPSAWFSLILLCLPPGAFAQVYINFANNPQLSHHDNMYFLRLPLIDDYSGIPGVYQDVWIDYTPATQSWRLMSYYKATPIEEAAIETVNVIVTDEMPAQVFIEVTGHLVCSAISKEVGIKQLGDIFTVYLFHNRGREFALCIGNAPPSPFRKVVPLDAYGLSAGTYSYTLNGKFGGSFTLAADNVLE